jgi:hypothetical protein
MDIGLAFSLRNAHLQEDADTDSISDVTVITVQSEERILVYDARNELLKLFDINGRRCIDSLQLCISPGSLDVHGTRACGTRLGKIYELRMSPNLALSKILHFDIDSHYFRFYKLDNDRLLVLNVASEDIHICICDTLTYKVDVYMQTKYQYRCPRYLTCLENDILVFVADSQLISKYNEACIVCLTTTGPRCNARWICQLDAPQRPVSLIIHAGTVLAYILNGPDNDSNQPLHQLLQLGLDHGDKLAVLSLPSECPELYSRRSY